MEAYGFDLETPYCRQTIRAAFRVLRSRLVEVGKPIRRVTRQTFMKDLGAGRSALCQRVTAEVHP